MEVGKKNGGEGFKIGLSHMVPPFVAQSWNHVKALDDSQHYAKLYGAQPFGSRSWLIGGVQPSSRHVVWLKTPAPLCRTDPLDQAILIAFKVKIASNSQAVSWGENTMVLTSWGVFPVYSNHMSTVLVIISGSYTCILYKRITPYTLSTGLTPFLLFFCVAVSKNACKDIPNSL